jgi:hypothetical protein
VINLLRSARAALLVLVTFSAAGSSTKAASDTAIAIGVKDRASANASIATDGDFVAIAWAARTQAGITDVYAATSRDGGRSFSAPVRVNHTAGDVNVSGEQPPRIALTPHRGAAPSLLVMWTAKGPSGTRLVSSRSADGGQSFQAAASVPGSDASGNRGWESLAISAQGVPVAVWLDHRDMAVRQGAASTTGGHQHGTAMQHKTDGAVTAQLSQIFFARLNDRASARAIAHGVCYCCKTSVATGADGTVVAAWRHVYPGNIRDIALTKSADGGRSFAPPVRVSEDNWVLDGCPENGPAVAIDQTNAIHVVWPTLVHDGGGGETLALFYSTSRDGQRFTTRQQIPTEGVPRHAQIALGPGATINVAWDEQINGTRRVVIARVRLGTANATRFTREPVTDRTGTYPVIASLPDAVVVAWTDGSPAESVLRVARFPAIR